MDIPLDSGQLLWLATGMSLLTLLATMLAVPWVVARLPTDYFTRSHRTTHREEVGAGFAEMLLMGLKNLLGAALVLLGIMMLLTPGQGLLTLLAGLLLMNFPGKYRLERYVVARPGVFRALNWLRQKQAQPAFEPPLVGPAHSDID